MSTEAELSRCLDDEVWNTLERKLFSLPLPGLWTFFVTTRMRFHQHLAAASGRVSDLLEKGRGEVKLAQMASQGARTEEHVTCKGGSGLLSTDPGVSDHYENSPKSL